MKNEANSLCADCFNEGCIIRINEGWEVIENAGYPCVTECSDFVGEKENE